MARRHAKAAVARHAKAPPPLQRPAVLCFPPAWWRTWLSETPASHHFSIF